MVAFIYLDSERERNRSRLRYVLLYPLSPAPCGKTTFLFYLKRSQMIVTLRSLNFSRWLPMFIRRFQYYLVQPLERGSNIDVSITADVRSSQACSRMKDK